MPYFSGMATKNSRKADSASRAPMVRSTLFIGEHLGPLAAVVEHVAGQGLGALQTVAGGPAALFFIAGGHGGGGEHIPEGRLQQIQRALIAAVVEQSDVEAGLAAHGGNIDHAAAVVAGEFGHQMLQRMQRRHLHMGLVRLADAEVILINSVAVAAGFFVGQAQIGRLDLGVVEVKALHVHFWGHGVFLERGLGK